VEFKGVRYPAHEDDYVSVTTADTQRFSWPGSGDAVYIVHFELHDGCTATGERYRVPIEHDELYTTTYLPANTVGDDLVQQLKQLWTQGLLFRLDWSDRENCFMVRWNVPVYHEISKSLPFMYLQQLKDVINELKVH